MQHKKFLALCAALAIVPATSGAAIAASASSRPTVTVEVKGLTRTLLKSTAVQAEKGSVTKGGTPKGKCPGDSAAGALDAATKHHWSGKYYSSVGGIFISSILGVKPTGKAFWSIYVNGKSATKGACSIKLKTGQKLLFRVVK